jgi:hypothetical protein
MGPMLEPATRRHAFQVALRLLAGLLVASPIAAGAQSPDAIARCMFGRGPASSAGLP